MPYANDQNVSLHETYWKINDKIPVLTNYLCYPRIRKKPETNVLWNFWPKSRS